MLWETAPPGFYNNPAVAAPIALRRVHSLSTVCTSDSDIDSEDDCAAPRRPSARSVQRRLGTGPPRHLGPPSRFRSETASTASTASTVASQPQQQLAGTARPRLGQRLRQRLERIRTNAGRPPSGRPPRRGGHPPREMSIEERRIMRSNTL